MAASRRITAAILLAAGLSTACAGGGDGDDDATRATTVDPDAALPEPLADFLDRVAEPGSVAFTATYSVLQRLGGATTEVTVESRPPAWTITAGDVRVTAGPRPETCVAGRCEPELREQALSSVGVFSRFFATGQADVLATAARRRGAEAPVFDERTLAGVPVDCVAVPVSGSVAAVGCLTPEGVFAYADGPATRFELVSYRPG